MEYNFCYLPHYCNCPDHEPIELDYFKLKQYERLGYPKFLTGHHRKGTHHDTSLETRDKISKANKGHTSPMKGKRRRKESNMKQSESMLGNIPWNKGLTGVQESPMKGKHHSIFTIQKIKQNTPIKSGKSHWNWQGGLTPLYKQIRYCDKYTEWRLSVFTRDNFLCQDCKNPEKKFVIAHHIKQFSEILRENNIISLEQALQCDILWDISNGLTLCEECHDKIPRKKNFFED